VGKDLAATPRKAVRRSRLYELIEYQPVTQSVDAVPAVMIPSPVNKYYLYELTTGSTSVSANFRTPCSNPGSSPNDS
jgi:polyhydroxyalkanoate synthase